jgi:putative ATP-binding cassette transporter
LNTNQADLAPDQGKRFLRYWKCAFGFWKGPEGLKACSLLLFLIILVLLQLLVQYLINFWNRDFFNALDKRDVSELWHEARNFIPLAISSITIAIFSVWAKMTVQRNWREWISKFLIHDWLKNNHYRRLTVMKNRQVNAEYRIAEDARVATDLPIDLLLGFIASILTAITFISVLWEVGGTLDLVFLGFPINIRGYLVIAAILYSFTLTSSMILVGRNLTHAVEEKNHSEAEFRSAGSRLREHGESSIPSEREVEERKAVGESLGQVIYWWKQMCYQLMRTTFITHGNGLIAPVIGLLFCTPKYLSGGMSLGEVVQAAAAFVTVQSSFNWLMDNYPKIADWMSSANRVAFLLKAIDELEKKD